MTWIRGVKLLQYPIKHSSKCIAVSKDNYISQENIITEVEKWLRYYKCKKYKVTAKAITVTEVAQLNFI